jgi:S-adenosylmethionine decarboxylase
MSYKGKHILAEFYNCKSPVLNDLKLIKKAMIEAAEDANCTIVGTRFHQFKPHGVTGVLVLSESHLSVHSWYEEKFVSIDIFSCGEHTEPKRALDKLIEFFKPEKHDFTEITRGH